ncbi:MAG: DUF2516 family protein, partial [Jatrophihabitans sp.]
MQAVIDLKYWTDHIVCWGLFALWIWALADCLLRRAAAFPASDKLTKPAWMAILVLSAFVGTLTMQPYEPWTSPLLPGLGTMVVLAVTVVAGVYLA